MSKKVCGVLHQKIVDCGIVPAFFLFFFFLLSMMCAEGLAS